MTIVRTSLIIIFDNSSSKDFDIKWVDDTHALAVFSTQAAAADAFKFPFPNLKLKMISQATPESRIKARRSTGKYNLTAEVHLAI